MTTHLKLVGELNESIQGSNNKLKSYQIIQQLFEYHLNFFGTNPKKNFLEKYLSAIDKLVDRKDYFNQISDDYIPVYFLIKNNLNYFFDESKKVFEISILKNFKMTEEDAFIKNLEYKGIDVLKGFKHFLNKVMPELNVYLVSTNEVIQHTFLDDIKNSIICTNINYVNNVDYECRIQKPKLSLTEINLEITELYLDICKTIGKELEYDFVKSHLFKCNCETCLTYAKKYSSSDAETLMFDIEFIRND